MDEAPKEFLIAITAKLMCKVACFCAKGQKCRYDIVVVERFEANAPIVMSGTVHKNECVFEPSDRHAVAKGNINMDDV